MKPGKILLTVRPTYSAGNVRSGREHFILALAKLFGWTNGAEIGVRQGRTLFHIVNQIPALTMYAVDRDTSQFWNEQIAQQLGHRIKVLEGTSWEMAQHVPDASLDFYFIDAGHGYKSVIKDIDAWTPKVKPTGWLLGHDINFPAVNQAVRDRFPAFEVGSDNVWFVNPAGDYSQLKKL